MSIERNIVCPEAFNAGSNLPYELRSKDFEIAMQDIYDFFYDVNTGLAQKGLARLDDMLRPANLSGTISDMLTASLGKHSRVLVQNNYHNGHPDLIVNGRYPNNSIKSGQDGVEIKSTRRVGGAVDTHGARDQWMCVFGYSVDNSTEPAINRSAMTFTQVYLGKVTTAEFRKNSRSELGTRTATLAREGIAKLRGSWVYDLKQLGNAEP